MKQFLIILNVTFSFVCFLFLGYCSSYEEKSDMKEVSSSRPNEEQELQRGWEMKNITSEKEINVRFRLDEDQLLFNWPIIFREVSKLTSPRGIGHC